MTTTTVDDTTLEHLDWHGLACDMNDDCGRLATWWAICLACSRHVPCCDRCRRELSLIVAMFAPDVGLECDGCHTASDPKRPWALITFVPIGAS